MNKIRLLGVAALLSVAACEGFKEAMTAHVDVAARAGGQELTVQRLADMMGRTPQVPLQKEAAQSIADVWVDYQLLGKAAANNDSLSDSTLIDEVMWPVYTRSRIDKFIGQVREKWQVDTTNLEQKYNAGDLLAASHILFQTQGQPPNASDSIRRKAEQVLKQTTSANFTTMAKRYGSDGTKDQGGNLGLFRHGQMVAEFEQAVAALKPGEIGPLVKTQFGFHIVRRNTYGEVKDQFRAAYDSLQMYKQDSAFVVNTDRAGNVQVKPTASRTVKEVAADPAAFKSDRTVVATSTAGDYTAAQVSRWISAAPQPEQTRMQIQSAADSDLTNFVKFLVRQELFLRQADSAKVQMDPSEKASVRQAFRLMVQNTWAGLRVSPALLADSAKTTAERERFAATRVDAFLDRLLLQQEQFIPVQTPLSNALRERYDAKVNVAGLERAVQTAQKIRAATDSTQKSQLPKSAVPMPSTPPDTSSRKKG